MKEIYLADSPKPVGHYAPGLIHNGLVYISGQIPMDLKTHEPFTGPIDEQTEFALRNVETILHAAGSSLDKVVQMTIFISDLNSWGAVNEAYARVMGEHRPARAIVPVGELHYGTGIEIQAVAAVND